MTLSRGEPPYRVRRLVMMWVELWFVNASCQDSLLLRATTHNDLHSGFRCFPFLSISPRLVIHIYFSWRTSVHKKGFPTPYEMDVIKHAQEQYTTSVSQGDLGNSNTW